MEDLPQYSGPMYLWPTIVTVNNAEGVLKQLTQKAQCHIATNAHDSSVADIRLALQRGGIDQYISEIFCFQRIGHKKPEANFFHYIMQSLCVPLNEMVMIGDNLDIDIGGAINMGMEAIWFNRGGKTTPSGIHSILALDELLACITSIK